MDGENSSRRSERGNCHTLKRLALKLRNLPSFADPEMGLSLLQSKKMAEIHNWQSNLCQAVRLFVQAAAGASPSS